MNVVSNASPLINLARIGQLDLLHHLYGSILVPTAVWQEVVVEGRGQPGVEEVGSAPWISKQSVSNRQLVQALQQELDAGEAEAIALAIEEQADLLLMDERLGRDNARHMGLRYTGMIGILVEAKHKGLIETIKPHLFSLRNLAGFRVSDALYERILQDEEET